MAIAKDETYHRLRFDQLEDAAAFIAALSRFAGSPANASSGGATSTRVPVVVLADTVTSSPQLDVYLNDAALDATTLGFGAPPVVETCGGSALPHSCVAVLSASASEAYGRDDIIRLLTTT